MTAVGSLAPSGWLAEGRARLATRSIREQFGRTMLVLGDLHPELVAVTCDLMHPTGMAEFGAKFPDKLINVGIAEQNATSIAAGLALCGKLPVLCGYAAFTSLRAVEQAKIDCAYNGAKVILAGLSAGLSYGVGGPTHQTYEDIAIMRAIPNMMVVVPADAVELDTALRAAVAARIEGPIYLRLGRDSELINEHWEETFVIGKARRLRSGNDICIVANGAMVAEAALASDYLAEQGIAAEVLNMHTVKPIDSEAIMAAAAQVRAMIVIEEHSMFGGLGAAVLEVLENGHDFPIRRIGIGDHFPPVGPVTALRDTLGLSADNIVAVARDLLAPKLA